jgi:hypothetical protein
VKQEMPSTKTRSEAKDAFKRILDAAMLGSPVFRDKPDEGAPVPSVVFTLITGVSRIGAIGLQESPTQRALEERYRIQIDCYHNDKVECDALADAVEQAIVDDEETLRSTYGIENVQKLDDSDVAPENEFARYSRVRMDFGFTTYRAVV